MDRPDRSVELLEQLTRELQQQRQCQEALLARLEQSRRPNPWPLVVVVIVLLLAVSTVVVVLASYRQDDHNRPANGQPSQVRSPRDEESWRLQRIIEATRSEDPMIRDRALSAAPPRP